MSATGLQLPTTQRSMPLCKEQRRQKFEEYLARKKAFSSLNLQEKQITSNTTNYNKKVAGDSIKKIPKAPKLTSTKMDNKENVNRPIWRKNILTVERNGIPLKSTNVLTNSTIEVDVCYPENCDQTIQVLPNEDDPKIRSVSLSQTFRLKRNNKEKQLAAEKLKQDATLPKKPVLGSYRGRVVQSKVNSFRKPSVVSEEGSMTNKTSSTTIPKTQSVSRIDIAVKGGRTTSITSSTKSNSIPSSQNKTAFQSSRKNQVDAVQNKEKEATVRTAVNVTIRREPLKKRLPVSNPVPPNGKTNLISSVKENEASSKCRTSVAVAIRNSESKPASTFSSKFREDSKIVDKRRYTLTRPPINTGQRTTLTKESAEERRARLLEWQNDKRRVIKRPPISGVPAPSKMELPKEKPVESFWTTIAEEDEQRLFTDKVNKIFSEYLNLINKGCPREEVLLTLEELIVKIPDAKKLVKYWVCLARLEPITSPLENIIAIYEKAILAGAQPMEEMRHTFADILTMKSQVTANSGENVDEVCSTNEEVRKLCEEVINRDKSDIVGTSAVENSESNDKDHKTRNVKIQVFEREQEGKAEDSNSDLETPDKETRGSYVIKYNVSTTPYLQSVKKKMNVDENSSSFKDLKFLTPVRRSRRLQEKFCKLPDMLKDHYPCVSSLEQLAELGSESSAYICRPNTALFASSLDEETKETEKK